MYVISFIPASIGVILLVCVAVQIFRFRRIRNQIIHGSKSDLVKKLGPDYKEKMIHSELSRYKWEKGIFIVRANFDKHGKLISSKVSMRLYKRKRQFFLL